MCVSPRAARRSRREPTSHAAPGCAAPPPTAHAAARGPTGAGRGVQAGGGSRRGAARGAERRAGRGAPRSAPAGGWGGRNPHHRAGGARGGRFDQCGQTAEAPARAAAARGSWARGRQAQEPRSAASPPRAALPLGTASARHGAPNSSPRLRRPMAPRAEAWPRAPFPGSVRGRLPRVGLPPPPLRRASLVHRSASTRPW